MTRIVARLAIFVPKGDPWATASAVLGRVGSVADVLVVIAGIAALGVLLSRPGFVFTRERLLDLVWDDASASLDRTVDAHVKTLRAKLKGVAPQLEPIRTHRGSGYALAEDLPPSL